MSRALAVFHAVQPDGTWVATCESEPDWFCFGDSLEETRARSEHALRDYIIKHTRLVHYLVPPGNAQLGIA